MESTQPDAKMLALVQRVVHFQQTGERAGITESFIDSPALIIIDSFAPYVFRGPEGLAQWITAFTEHVKDMDALTATLETPQEYSTTDATAFFSQPIRWRYRTPQGDADELGGLAVTLENTQAGWRIAALGWAVTSWITT